MQLDVSWALVLRFGGGIEVPEKEEQGFGVHYTISAIRTGFWVYYTIAVERI